MTWNDSAPKAWIQCANGRETKSRTSLNEMNTLGAHWAPSAKFPLKHRIYALTMCAMSNTPRARNAFERWIFVFNVKIKSRKNPHYNEECQREKAFSRDLYINVLSFHFISFLCYPFFHAKIHPLGIRGALHHCTVHKIFHFHVAKAQ